MANKRKYPTPSWAETVLAAELRRVREDRHICRMAIADELGVSESNVCCWELGRHRPNLDQLRIWADLLGMKLDICLNVKEAED